MKSNSILIGFAAACFVGYLVYGFQSKTTQPDTLEDGSSALVSIEIPTTLSESAMIGKSTYDIKCMSCHGPNAVGQKGVAPPLIHKIYEPSHHGDESFQLAAAQGVRAHHWTFGDMPPVEGLTRGDMKMVISYIRELQVLNGID